MKTVSKVALIMVLLLNFNVCYALGTEDIDRGKLRKENFNITTRSSVNRPTTDINRPSGADTGLTSRRRYREWLYMGNSTEPILEVMIVMEEV